MERLNCDVAREKAGGIALKTLETKPLRTDI
jgi:hypothetical protein